ncbi:MAG: hypothetical protein IJ772_03080 [Bacilli bacterium]|nr:hypothetical protein [Bacilli bacterium]MBR1817812.1 hypothetical protein [Bacilli bacterium]
MNLKNLEDIKDEDLEQIINDKKFLEMWQNEIKDTPKPDGIIMKISISNDEDEKVIYHTELDFKHQKGTIIAKEIIKKFFHKDK